METVCENDPIKCIWILGHTPKPGMDMMLKNVSNALRIELWGRHSPGPRLATGLGTQGEVVNGPAKILDN